MTQTSPGLPSAYDQLVDHVPQQNFRQLMTKVFPVIRQLSVKQESDRFWEYQTKQSTPYSALIWEHTRGWVAE